MSGDSQLTTYDSALTVYSGPNGCSEIAAPPTTGRRSSTTTRWPARARYAAATSPLCPPPTITASYLLVPLTQVPPPTPRCHAHAAAARSPESITDDPLRKKSELVTDLRHQTREPPMEVRVEQRVPNEGHDVEDRVRDDEWGHAAAPPVVRREHDAHHRVAGKRTEALVKVVRAANQRRQCDRD